MIFALGDSLFEDLLDLARNVLMIGADLEDGLHELANLVAGLSGAVERGGVKPLAPVGVYEQSCSPRGITTYSLFSVPYAHSMVRA